MKELINAKEAAAIRKVSERAIYNWMNNHPESVIKEDGIKYIKRSDIDLLPNGADREKKKEENRLIEELQAKIREQAADLDEARAKIKELEESGSLKVVELLEKQLEEAKEDKEFFKNALAAQIEVNKANQILLSQSNSNISKQLEKPEEVIEAPADQPEPEPEKKKGFWASIFGVQSALSLLYLSIIKKRKEM